MRTRTRTILASILTSLLWTGASLAQSTAFTYQGQLMQGGQPASGAFDVRFRLYDTPSGGPQTGPVICFNDLQVTNGTFTTQLDYGQVFASTGARFLEIEVRQNTTEDCDTDPATYTILSPRQLITAAPRASAAAVANALAAPDGSPLNAVMVDNAGSVGIGTTTPGHSMTIAKPAPTIALQDTDNAGTAGGQQVGYISYRDNSNIEKAWIGYGTAGDPDFSIINVRPSGDIVLNPFNGNVGVGTASPVSKLEVHGDIRLGPAGQFRAPAAEENLRIIRGSIHGDGGIRAGSGFTVTRPSQARYLITFATPFAVAPTVTATSLSVPSLQIPTFMTTISATATSVELRLTYGNSSNLPQDNPFDFIAIGPR